MNTTINHPVVAHDSWLAERSALLADEKELTHLRARIASRRRALPWERVDKDYVFATAQGPRRLAELFGDKRQLIVQHFMLGPGWAQGCPSCSFMADHMGGMMPHLAARDVAVLAVSRAPLAEIEAFRARLGWSFPWVSSHGSDFNYDYGVSFTPEQQAAGAVDYNYQLQSFPKEEAPGISVFVKDDAGQVFHTYSTYGRGLEAMMGTYELLDLTPQGRNEDALPYPMAWVRHHDRYETAPQQVASCCQAGA